MENRVEADKQQCAHTAHEIQPGGCGHHHFEKATDMLSDEHRVIERVLAVLQKLTTRPVENSLDSLEEGAGFLQSFCGPVPPF